MLEVALIIPVFLALIFGIMEFSYAATQNAEVRHAAEEGARAAAVGNNVSAAVCGSMVVVNGATYAIAAAPGGGLPDGETVQNLVVTAGYRSLTGLIPESWTLSAESSIYVEPAGLPLPGGGPC